ncbi:MAG TPA: type IVB secretion system protein IcmH/DotU [Cellvibrio sp.]|nr:type IVB secretion system protein IcmH/DotU [Cellvibrio sp.]
MSDESDKTVFRQPTPGGERTLVQPTPGGRGVGGSPRTSVNIPQPGRAQAAPRAAAIDNGSYHFNTGSGLNPLVNACSTLIAVFDQTRRAVSHPDVGGLYQRLMNEIKTFEERARDLGIKPEIILSARYLMCSVVDEAVLNTPWGTNSGWGQRTLLSVFHGETSGGEKSFLICDRMRQSPAENLDILELFYICLNLGFEGKYRLMNRGRDALDQLREELFAIIRRHRGEYERALAPHWMGLGNTRNPITEYVPLWVVISLAAAILFFSYTGFRYWLYISATPVAEELIDITGEKK